MIIFTSGKRMATRSISRGSVQSKGACDKSRARVQQHWQSILRRVLPKRIKALVIRREARIHGQQFYASHAELAMSLFHLGAANSLGSDRRKENRSMYLRARRHSQQRIDRRPIIRSVLPCRQRQSSAYRRGMSCGTLRSGPSNPLRRPREARMACRRKSSLKCSG